MPVFGHCVSRSKGARVSWNFLHVLLCFLVAEYRDGFKFTKSMSSMKKFLWMISYFVSELDGGER